MNWVSFFFEAEKIGYITTECKIEIADKTEQLFWKLDYLVVDK